MIHHPHGMVPVGGNLATPRRNFFQGDDSEISNEGAPASAATDLQACRATRVSASDEGQRKVRILLYDR